MTDNMSLKERRYWLGLKIGQSTNLQEKKKLQLELENVELQIQSLVRMVDDERRG